MYISLLHFLASLCSLGDPFESLFVENTVLSRPGPRMMNSGNCTTDAFLHFLLLLLIVNEKESEKKYLQYHNHS